MNKKLIIISLKEGLDNDKQTIQKISILKIKMIYVMGL